MRKTSDNPPRGRHVPKRGEGVKTATFTTKNTPPKMDKKKGC